MTADELGGRVNHHVGSVLNGTDEERCSECVVNDNYGVMLMCYLRYAVDVSHAGVGIAEGLDDNRLGVLLECLIHCVEVRGVNDCCLHALC